VENGEARYEAVARTGLGIRPVVTLRVGF
jgi:hypothetical protein